MNAPAPYASEPSQSRGRRYRTDESPTRSEFQRDRDRIIHSTAFRRLQHKTQVFLHHEGQHFRTRLTHTLEVSQMARSMARALSLNEDLAEAVALVHDLGHTPFGHAGERVLNEKMAGLGGFDHNMQALRVVTELENRYADHDGLNLSWETLEGILKHNGPLIGADGVPVAHYAQGLPFGIDRIEAAADLELASHASLEAQVAAIADDIAYNAHDIDDALRAGLLTLEGLRAVPLVGPIVTQVLERYRGIEPNRQAHEVQRRLITSAIVDVIETTQSALDADRPGSADAVRAAGKTYVAFSPAMAVAVDGLKRYLFANVYRAEAVMAPVRASQGVVADLFEHYLATGAMPGRWAQKAERAADQVERARVVCDFIAGMTDPYASEQHQRLFDAGGQLG